MKYDYAVGGNVLISSKWYEIKDVGKIFKDNLLIAIYLNKDLDDVTRIEECFIQDYQPPAKPVTIEHVGTFDHGDGFATLSNGFTIAFSAAQLLSLESFN